VDNSDIFPHLLFRGRRCGAVLNFSFSLWRQTEGVRGPAMAGLRFLRQR
jgi:hypothetical protein